MFPSKCNTHFNRISRHSTKENVNECALSTTMPLLGLENIKTVGGNKSPAWCYWTIVEEKLQVDYRALYSKSLEEQTSCHKIIIWEEVETWLWLASEPTPGTYMQHIFIHTPNDRHTERASKETDRAGKHFMDFFSIKWLTDAVAQLSWWLVHV